MLAHRTAEGVNVPPLPILDGALTLNALFADQPIEKFCAGACLFWERDPARHVFEVVEGVFRLVKVLEDGRRVITGFIYPGELLGLSMNNRHPYTAEAITGAKVRRFIRGRFDGEMDRSPSLRPALFAHLSDEMAATQDQITLLARRNAEERVASFLLSIVRRFGLEHEQQPEIYLPMSRADMADYLGLTIETVSRIVSRFARQGLIALNERRFIVIRRPGKLAAIAAEDAEDEDY